MHYRIRNILLYSTIKASIRPASSCFLDFLLSPHAASRDVRHHISDNACVQVFLNVDWLCWSPFFNRATAILNKLRNIPPRPFIYKAPTFFLCSLGFLFNRKVTPNTKILSICLHNFKWIHRQRSQWCVVNTLKEWIIAGLDLGIKVRGKLCAQPRKKNNNDFIIFI